MNPTIPTDQARQARFQQTLLSARRTMVLSETLKLALDSFKASKMRFALTALGMVIGTASVILVITIGSCRRSRPTPSSSNTPAAAPAMPRKCSTAIR
jgi:hypothetical protein